MERVASYLTSAIASEYPNLGELKIKRIKFGLECLLSECSKFTTYFFIFWLLSLAQYYSIAFLFICIPRLFAGGYHSKTYWGCFFVTFAGLGSAIFLGYYFKIDFLTKFILLLIALSLAAIFAPVDHPNKPIISEKRRKLFRYFSVVCFLVFGTTALCIHHPLATTAILALFIEAISLPIGFLNKERNSEAIGAHR